MTSIMPPMCMLCRRFREGDGEHGFTCDAFPDGIPSAIIKSEADHREPYDGDGGMQFVPFNDEAAKLVEEIWQDRASDER